MIVGDDTEPKNILVGDNWNPVLKTVAFKIVRPFRRAKQVHRTDKRHKEFWPYRHVWRRVEGSTFAIKQVRTAYQERKQERKAVKKNKMLYDLGRMLYDQTKDERKSWVIYCTTR